MERGGRWTWKSGVEPGYRGPSMPSKKLAPSSPGRLGSQGVTFAPLQQVPPHPSLTTQDPRLVVLRGLWRHGLTPSILHPYLLGLRGDPVVIFPAQVMSESGLAGCHIRTKWRTRT